MNEEMNVVYACNDSYVIQTGISIISLLENNKDNDICIYFFGDKISDKNKKIITSIVEKYNQKIVFNELPDLDKMAEYELRVNFWAKAAYLRLFFTMVMPLQINRLLWLDGDTIILKDIKEFYNTNISDYACAGVLDATSLAKRLNGFKRNEKYFNTGVLLINMEYWRNNNVYEKMKEEIKYRHGNSIDVDQSYINCVLKNKIKVLKPRYNFMSYYEDAVKDYSGYLNETGYKGKEIYSQKEIIESYNDICIIHYATKKGIRPWFSNATLPFSEIWHEYYNVSPWRDITLISDNNTQMDIKPNSIKKMLKKVVVNFDLTRKIYVNKKYGFWPHNK